MPIPPKYEMFLWAIDQFVRLENGTQPHEQQIAYDGRQWSIGDIADDAAGRDEEMPEGVRSALFQAAPAVPRHRYLEPPNGNTFAGGGWCLRRMYDDLKSWLKDDRVWLSDAGLPLGRPQPAEPDELEPDEAAE